jgi:hypothetical protein
MITAQFDLWGENNGPKLKVHLGEITMFDQ